MSEYPISAPRLLGHSHAHFLEQLSDQEFWQYASDLARTQPLFAGPSQEYLLCELEHGQCFLPLAGLREVIPPPHAFTLLPTSPSWMHGIVAWHGETIAVVDLDAYLFQQPMQATPDGLFLVAQVEEVGDVILGLYVKSVRSITAFETAAVIQAQTDTSPYPHACLGAIKGTYADAPVLDIAVILTDIVQHIKMAASHE